ncbi:hypothetical protein MLD38_026558 [Melastoma candidum]|uniref:Uncharacterized protein n=1 Tax=Melastoma candidum TaxID=119954 RepID=A0ACB9P0J0_9MYRT|nr:hypothetical protein MLD38_026558 [Melastoma candidum]
MTAGRRLLSSPDPSTSSSSSLESFSFSAVQPFENPVRGAGSSVGCLCHNASTKPSANDECLGCLTKGEGESSSLGCLSPEIPYVRPWYFPPEEAVLFC